MISLMSILVIAYLIYVIITIVYIILDNKETPTTFAWILVIILLPIIGLIIYVLIGRSGPKTTKKQKMREELMSILLKETLRDLSKQQQRYIKKIEKENTLKTKHKLFHLLYNNSKSMLTTKNKVKLIKSGKEKFDLLIKDLEKAESFIHFEYYIWRSDKLTEKIKDILIKKAKQGVEIRILYDHLGGFFIKKKYKNELKKAGVKINTSQKYNSLFRLHRLNHRDHIKIVVIDGKIGYTGGMNMGEEYVTGGKKFNYWKDTHLRLEGQAVDMLQAVFSTMWLNSAAENLFIPKYYPKKQLSFKKTPIQITFSGADTEWSSIKQLYISLINSAEKKVYIQSPYFIPEPGVATALQISALSGIDTRILITGVPDKKLPYWVAFTYFKPLLKAGVKIYHYKKGFMHSKTINVDEKICSVGTANMDIRSFKLNYETNTLIYDEKIAQELEKDFLTDLENSKEFTLEDYNKLNKVTKLRNSLARLLGPLL